MQVVTCGGCGTRVYPKADGNCPSCGATTVGAPAVVLVSDDIAARRALDEELNEQAHRSSELRDLSARARRYFTTAAALFAAWLILVLFNATVRSTGSLPLGQIVTIVGTCFFVGGIYEIVQGLRARKRMRSQVLNDAGRGVNPAS
jgi:hypothetical protein